MKKQHQLKLTKILNLPDAPTSAHFLESQILTTSTLNHPNIQNTLSPRNEFAFTTERAECPERLIEGLSDYIVLQAKSGTTVNY
jgi:hypothetical protein